MRRLSPVVYVGVVTYNSARLMDVCFAALSRQIYPHIQIVVFDNHSSDNIAKLMRKYPHARFIQSSKNVGYGRGHNSILRTIRFKNNDYYLTLNPDARLSPTYISRLVSSCRRHNAGWAVGKLHKDANKTALYSAGHAMLRDGYAFNIGYGMKDGSQYSVSRKIFGAPGAAALYSRALIRGLSKDGDFFDPALFLYYEDIDIDWRANLAGYACWFEPSAVAIHKGGVAPSHMMGDILCNRFYVVMKNAFVSDLLTYNLPVITFHLLARLVSTPLIGARMIGLCAVKAPVALYKRTAARTSKSVMHQWFRAAKNEVSMQPKNIRERIKAFTTTR